MKNDYNVDTKKVFYKVEDFLKDDEFIKYVLTEAPGQILYWETLLMEHPELRKVFEEAKAILLAPEDIEVEMTQFEKDALKRSIFADLEIET